MYSTTNNNNNNNKLNVILIVKKKKKETLSVALINAHFEYPIEIFSALQSKQLIIVVHFVIKSTKNIHGNNIGALTYEKSV